MFFPALAVIIGLALLVWSADKLVEGATSCAFHLGIPSIIVGILIVGFGTSSPEILVSVLASLNGNSGIVIGNAYGSNIANIALILGISSLIYPISVQESVLKREVPILILITVLAGLLYLDSEIDFWDGLILLGIFSIYLFNTIRISYQHSPEKNEEDVSKYGTLWNGILWLLIGLVLLIGSSRMLVWGATEIATQLGVSDLIIGLTVIAIGTSLPELATSIIAARKKEHGLSIGNVIGSNSFNTLIVVGIGSLIAEIPVETDFLYRDLPLTLALTLLLFFFCLGKKRQINRIEGSFLFLIFVVYNLYLISLVL